jgi:hypothetical protein
MKLEKLEEIFNRKVEDILKQLVIMNADIAKRLNMTQTILLRGIQEATEVNVPTTFIILHERLTKSTVKSIQKDKESLAQFFTSFVGLMSNQFQDNGKFYDLYKVVYLYLIDEYTGQPIIPDDDKTQYPIKITEYLQFMKSVASFLSIGFKFVTAVNELSGLCALLGYPTISLPREVMNYEDKVLSDIASGSDVNDFQVLQKCVVESNKNFKNDKPKEEIKSVRGSALRELERFFAKEDTANDFCGLQKVLSPTGQCIWTTDENYQKMKTESEKVIVIAEPFDRSFFKDNMKRNEAPEASNTDESIEENRCWLWTCPSCKNLWCTCCNN